MAAALSYGKRMLKAGLRSFATLTKKRRLTTPDEDAEYWCVAGLDKEGFKVKYISDYKGFGVFSTEVFTKGSFLLEYVGEKITEEEAEERERKNPENKMFYFKSSLDGKKYCIDAAATVGHICQFVNDATEANGVMKLKKFKGHERLCLFALRDIHPGDEIAYSYGDDRNLWWREKENAVTDPYDFDTSLDSDPFSVDSYASDSGSSDADIGTTDPYDIFDLQSISGQHETVSTVSIPVPVIPFSTSQPLSTISMINSSQPLSTISSAQQLHTVDSPQPLSRDSRSEPLTTVSSPLALCTVSSAQQVSTVNIRQSLSTAGSSEPMPTVSNPQHLFTVNSSKSIPELSCPELLPTVSTGKPPSTVRSPQPLCTDSRVEPLSTVSSPQPRYTVINPQPLCTDNTCEPLSTVSRLQPLLTVTSRQSLCTDSTDEPLSTVSNPHPLSTVSSLQSLAIVSSPQQLNTDSTDEPCFTVSSSQPLCTDSSPQPLSAVNCPQPLSTVNSFHQCLLEDGVHQNLDFGITEDSNMSLQVPVQTTGSVSLADDFGILGDNHRESKLVGDKKARNKPKPDRYCLYCETVISGGKLKRHIKRKHKTVPEVQEIMRQSNTEQNAFFDQKRREGIYEYNLKLLAQEGEPDVLMRERKPTCQEDHLRVCLECKGFFGNKFFFKHKCVKDDHTPEPLKPKLLQPVVNKMDSDEDFIDILNRFRDTEVGDICRTNQTIKLIGYRHFNLRRHEEGKRDEVRKVVMSDMRELSRLYIEFKSQTNEEILVEDMFTRVYLPQLVDSIQELARKPDEPGKADVPGKLKEKHGQKLLLDAIILRSVKALKGYYAESIQDDKKRELKSFKDAYKHKSCEIYPSARQTCIKNSLEKSRRPSSLPSESDLRQLKVYTTSEIQYYVQNFSLKNYAWLRNLVVARLTLHNARRGEEASRILLKEWKDVENGIWLPEGEVEKVKDPAEKYLFGKYKLGYLHGKGKKYVPVLVLVDLLPAIEIIIKHRLDFGVKNNNTFLFATKNSLSHCSGWHAVAEVCKRSEIHIPITATKMRHNLSSMYASLDMDERDRKVFLEHMGHLEQINKENYQCPQGVRTLCVMGKVLTNMDGGEKSTDCYGKQGDDACPDTDIFSQGEKSTDFYHGKQGDGACSDTDIFSQVKWLPQDTKAVQEYFKEFMSCKEALTNNKGCLPTKQDILHFLNHEGGRQMASLKDLDSYNAYKKVYTKVFNERKKLRLNIAKGLQKLCK